MKSKIETNSQVVAIKRPTREALQGYFETENLPDPNNVEEIRSFVTSFLIAKHDLYEEDDINRGRCFIWAYLVWALSGPEVKFVSHSGHVCVQNGEQFYDSRFLSFDKCHVLRVPSTWKNLWHWDVNKMVAYWCRWGIYSHEFFRVVCKLSGVTVDELNNNISELAGNNY